MSKSFHSIPCPHCASRSIVRSSRGVTRLVRDIYFICSESRCGHTFVAQLAVVRSLSPSACPDPRVNLPLRIQPIKLDPTNDDNPELAAANG